MSRRTLMVSIVRSRPWVDKNDHVLYASSSSLLEEIRLIGRLVTEDHRRSISLPGCGLLN